MENVVYNDLSWMFEDETVTFKIKGKCTKRLDYESLEACLRVGTSLLHTDIADLETDTGQHFTDVFPPPKLDCFLKSINSSIGFMLTTVVAKS
jgi:hypothetical protein